MTITTSGAPGAGKARQRMLRGANNPEQPRIFLYLLFTFIQRLERLRREMYAGDIDLAAINEAVALSASDPLYRDAAWREKYTDLNTLIGTSGQRGVNALSIAQATGIPRETTRRKVKKLAELGAITELGRGEYVSTPGFLQREITPERFDQTIADLLRFMNEALGSGIFALSDPQE